MPEFEGPRTVGDLMKFVEANGLAREEYFAPNREMKPEYLLYTPETRWVAVFWVEGGSEGYYVHVERLVKMPALDYLVAQNVALGKYWSKASASMAVALLTPFVHGLYPV